MSGTSRIRNIALLAVAFWLTGCAATEALVQTPAVTLTSVELEKISFTGQTFLLGFDVQNPNAFPLPVKMITFNVMLEGRKFAGGEARCDIMIPARGDGSFVMSVELDLLRARDHLASIVRGGASGAIDYELAGSMTLDIPLTRPITFSRAGTVVVQPGRF